MIKLRQRHRIFKVFSALSREICVGAADMIDIPTHCIQKDHSSAVVPSL